jgi:hypothetical protein
MDFQASYHWEHLEISGQIKRVAILPLYRQLPDILILHNREKIDSISMIRINRSQSFQIKYMRQHRLINIIIILRHHYIDLEGFNLLLSLDEIFQILQTSLTHSIAEFQFEIEDLYGIVELECMEIILLQIETQSFQLQLLGDHGVVFIQL